MKNKKQLTLNQTWILCLRMWRWVAKVWQTPRYKRYEIHELKAMWLRKNGYFNNLMVSDCFFCDYKYSEYGFSSACGSSCPGALINPGFHCADGSYSFKRKPVKFYKELLRLNRIRKAKN